MGLRWFRCAGLLIAVVIGAAAPTAAAQTGSASDVGPASLGPAPGPEPRRRHRGRRTLNFDNGWRFKLVNTANATDPSGVYGDSSDPHAAAPELPRLRLAARHAAARLEHHPAPAPRPEQRHRLLPRRPRLVPQDVHAAGVDDRQARSRSTSTACSTTPTSTSTGSCSGTTRTATPATASTSPTLVHTDGTRRTCSPWSSRTRSRAAAGTRAAGSPATST